jgi:hypothetical protein
VTPAEPWLYLCAGVVIILSAILALVIVKEYVATPEQEGGDEDYRSEIGNRQHGNAYRSPFISQVLPRTPRFPRAAICRPFQ